MKDLLQNIADYGPQFFNHAVGMCSGPKRYLSEIDLNDKDALQQALLFYCICVGVSFLLRIPYSDRSDSLLISFVVLIVLFVSGSMLAAAVVKASFRLVGGKGKYLRNLIITLYITGPPNIFAPFFSVAAKGIVKIREPEKYAQFEQYVREILTLNFSNIG